MITEALLESLKEKDFRDAFVAAHARQSVQLQVTELMRQLGMSQTALSEVSDVAQPTISRVLDPEYGGGATVNTLVRIANGCDVVFVPHFVPFTDLLDWLGRHDRVYLPTFTEQLNNGEFSKYRRPQRPQKRKLPICLNGNPKALGLNWLLRRQLATPQLDRTNASSCHRRR